MPGVTRAANEALPDRLVTPLSFNSRTMGARSARAPLARRTHVGCCCNNTGNRKGEECSIRKGNMTISLAFPRAQPRKGNREQAAARHGHLSPHRLAVRMVSPANGARAVRAVSLDRTKSLPAAAPHLGETGFQGQRQTGEFAAGISAAIGGDERTAHDSATNGVFHRPSGKSPVATERVVGPGGLEPPTKRL